MIGPRPQAAGVVLLAALLGVGACGDGSDGGDARVADVVDGDTLEVRLPGDAVERVRIIGVNAPESSECFADEATAALAALVDGEEVVLVADRSDRDRYGRLLRYVEVDGVDVGERLVREGAAVVRVSAPDTAREAVLRAAQDEARAGGTGLWAPDACGAADPAAAVVRITALRLDADGDDAANLNDEWVEIANEGPSAVELGDWGLRDESASHRFVFPSGFVLDPGALVRVRSGCGVPTATDQFWCATGSAVWNNDGDTAFLVDPDGNVVDDHHEAGR
jgi:micrococcal nuclease